MINEANIKDVKYGIERIPDSWFGNVPLNGEVAPPILDVKAFSPYVISLSGIQVTGVAPGDYAFVNLRARYDGMRIEENAAAMLAALVGAWNLPAKTNLYFNFFGLALVANFSTFYGLWVIKPTVAHKLLYSIPLSRDEQALADKLGIKDSVEKGVLPLPISQQIEREYPIMGEETHARSVNIAAINTVYNIENIYPQPGEIVVLTRVASAEAVAGNGTRLHIDRDNDADYANIQTFPLGLGAGGEIDCFIPAIKEIKLTATAVGGPPGFRLFRYTFQRIKLNNILRARFGLATKDELPGDVFEKVSSGVL